MNFCNEIPKPIIGLSPMDGITDASFRFITAVHGGADVTITEFVNVETAFYAPQTLIKDFTYTRYIVNSLKIESKDASLLGFKKVPVRD